MKHKQKIVIKPIGWLKEFIESEFENGYLGSLDEILPDIFSDDIYFKDRIGLYTKAKDLGVQEVDEEHSNQFFWWNSETISNYYNGLTKNAFMLENKEQIKKVTDFVEHILKSQEPEGYIGIYKDNLRYLFQTENGELWSKTTLFRVLLSYYHYTGNVLALNAVIRATNELMANIPIHQGKPFAGENTFAGVSHGLMFVDVLYHLYQLTTHHKYLDYAIYLYEDYNKHKVSERDVLIENLENPDYKFQGHGPHTYEHLRVLAIIAKHTDKYKHLLDLYLAKLQHYILPSGGPVGDEWIYGRKADADHTGYEYCSIFELLNSLIFVSELFPEKQHYQLIENIFLNASFGSRHPVHHTVAYLKNDNSYNMQGKAQFKLDEKSSENRYKYSPTHQDMAVCCAPNATRIIPDYIEHCFSLNNKTLTLNYFIPVQAKFLINNVPVEIRVDTNYPFSNLVHIQVESKQEIDFELVIRPESKNIFLDSLPGTSKLSLNKKKHEIYINLRFNVKMNYDLKQDIYFSYGSLVYAMPLKSQEKITRRYATTQLFDSYEIIDEEIKEYHFDQNDFSKIYIEQSKYYSSLFIPLIIEGKKEYKEFIPIGKTILRRVTFPLLKEHE